MLTESTFNGGGGYTLEQVGQMTPDQIWCRLCDMDMLKNEIGSRTKTMPSLEVPTMVDVKDGLIAGRAADGTPIKGVVRGKSRARELMEQAEAARRAAKQPRRKRRRMKGRSSGN